MSNTNRGGRRFCAPEPDDQAGSRKSHHSEVDQRKFLCGMAHAPLNLSFHLSIGDGAIARPARERVAGRKRGGGRQKTDFSFEARTLALCDWMVKHA